MSNTSKKQRVESSYTNVSQQSTSSINASTNKSATTTITSGVCVDGHPDRHQSTPSNVWCLSYDEKPKAGDQTTVNAVVTAKVFPKVKFVDKDTELMYSTDKKSISQFIIKECNLQPEVKEAQWWLSVHKYVGQTISRLRNDRNTAVKWAMLGKLQRSKYACKCFGCTYLTIDIVLLFQIGWKPQATILVPSKSQKLNLSMRWMTS